MCRGWGRARSDVSRYIASCCASPIATGVYPGCASLNAQVGQARLPVGEGSSAGGYRLAWVRGLPHRATISRLDSRREPLIRRFAPPSPTRGEGKRAASWPSALPAHHGVDADRPAPRGREIKAGEAERDRETAAVDHREEALWEVRNEIGERHLA